MTKQKKGSSKFDKTAPSKTAKEKKTAKAIKKAGKSNSEE